MSKPIKRQSWSRLDVLGLINGISIWDPQYKELKYVRRPFDSNLTIRSKIFKYHDYPVDTTQQGIINALSHEFDYTPYNVKDNKIFELSYKPSPSGAKDIQDIWAYYKEPNGSGWNYIPQIWSAGYKTAKAGQRGFIVWQNERYVNISGIKNFTYASNVEVMHNIPDNSELKFIYFVTDYDEDNNKILVKYTDIDNPNDPNDTRFKYRKANSAPSLSGILAYTLDTIPTGIYSYYYNNDGTPTRLLYTIKNHLDKKFKHTWGKLTDRECLWDIHKLYGSGHIPYFYDAIAPDNNSWCSGTFSGYIGGIEELSDSLYPEEILESSGSSEEWYLHIYPGKFYVDGIPFYYFENPQTSYLSFVSGQATLPSGLTRGMHTIMALSGYYDTACSGWFDPYLSGKVYEDYNYQTGEDGQYCWTHIYRRRPYITSVYDHKINLQEGEYNIDFTNSKIYSHSDTISDAMIIWDQVLQPSGFLLSYDLNPLNNENLTLDKYFLFMKLDNR